MARTALAHDLRDLQDGLAEVRGGAEIAPELAVRLLACPEEQLPELLSAAREIKHRFKPAVITYSRKVFVPLTNLCRDYCGYCIFRRSPGDSGAYTMSPDQVLEVARAGERLGCREALFSLGDKPELAFPEMRETLRRLGYRSTLHYLEAMCEQVLRQTGLIPHANPGLLSSEWLQRLRKVSPSIGLMLESTSNALFGSGAAHDNAPDKLPASRLATIEAAGKLRIPFTTGILIGIGESHRDRVESLFAIRELHRHYGHIQEVIVQNFRTKPGIPMSTWPEPSQADMLRTVAVARLILGDMNLQAPPNLSAPDYDSLLSAGINDWGGVSPLTPDFINPERPWPHLEELEGRTAMAGCELRQRLPVYPEFLPMVAAAGGLAWERTRAAATVDGYATAERLRSKERIVITVLTGGTGGAKLVWGLAQIVPQEEITCIVNTGDDMRWWELHISPDLDSIMYVLAGLLSRERGWGFEGDTFHCLDRMRALGADAWFQLGDRDLATHLRRTQLLAEGHSLTQATAALGKALGVKERILPMSDAAVETRIRTPHAELNFQEYFVRERWQHAVLEVDFAGISEARPAPGVLDAIQTAETVVLAPSNPVTSIGPILAVAGIRDALRATSAPVLAVSPIIAGAAVSGPAAGLMRAYGLHPSAPGIAEAYRDFLNVLLIDEQDAGDCCADRAPRSPGCRRTHADERRQG